MRKAYADFSLGRPTLPTSSDRPHDPLTQSLLRAAAGDADAFADVYEEVAGRVYGITLRVIGDPHQAEEVAQEALVEVWRRCAAFDPSRGSAGGWITTIAHHKAVDRVRSSEAARRRDASWHEQSGEQSLADTTYDDASAHLRSASILAALTQLPPVQRRAIELAYFGGYTYADVARLMQAPVGTTKTRIRNALRLLRENLDRSLVEIA